MSVRARVLGRQGLQFPVWLEDRQREVRAWARRRVFEAAQGIYAGDIVEVEALGPEDYVIERVMERRNRLVPPGVANLDLLLIVMSWTAPPLDEVTIHKIRLAATAHRIPIQIVITKMDLITTDAERARWEAFRNRYLQAGFLILGVSVWTGEGLDALRNTLQDRVSALAGPTGVGKSALLNALIPGAQLRVGELHPRMQRGRHTTTWTTLLALPGGGWVADTPGFSRLELAQEVTWDIIRAAFPWARLTGDPTPCQFDDCLHRTEPGCAVRRALASGRLERRWYEVYIGIVQEFVRS